MARVSEKKLTGWHVLAYLAGFFGLIFAVNGYFAYVAIRTNSGLDDGDAYRKGLQYNVRADAGESQEKLGWRSELGLSGLHGPITLKLVDQSGAPVTGLALNGVLGRPATDRFDRKIELKELSPGVYQTGVGGDLEPGNWVVALDAYGDARQGADPVYRLRRRLWLKPGA